MPTSYTPDFLVLSDLVVWLPGYPGRWVLTTCAASLPGYLAMMVPRWIKAPRWELSPLTPRSTFVPYMRIPVAIATWLPFTLRLPTLTLLCPQNGVIPNAEDRVLGKP